MMFSFTGNEASEQIKPELIDNYLSFGEEKIITAMLFILYKSSDKRTMFLFDDPVTLFDKNKRFAFFNLLQTLKRESWLNSKRSRKIIKQSDYIVVLSHSFEALKESLTIEETISYIAKNYGGYFEIDKITKNNLNNYYKNISLMIESTNSLLVKLVLFRNLIQTNYITDTSNIMYNTISSLTKWELPATKDRSRIYSNDEIKEVINNIENTKLIKLNSKELLESLEFKNIIDSYNEELNWYEKIILFRIIMDIINIKDVDKVTRRFITTLFHVENDYLFNLDHKTNQTIPKYVIDILDGKIKELKENIDYNNYTMPKELKVMLE